VKDEYKEKIIQEISAKLWESHMDGYAKTIGPNYCREMAKIAVSLLAPVIENAEKWEKVVKWYKMWPDCQTFQALFDALTEEPA